MTTQTQPPILFEQMPPCNIEAEESALGCMIANGESVRDGLAALEPADFYIIKNQWVYESIRALHARGSAVDFVTLTNELEQRGLLKEVGGSAYVSTVLNRTPSFLHIKHYAALIKEQSINRQLLNLASEIAKSAYDGQQSTAEKITVAYDKLRSIKPSGSRTSTIADAASALFDEVEYFAENPIGCDEVRGFSLGIPELDRMTGGLNLDDMTVVTARPGIGKTALVLQVADVLATRGKRVLIYSLEMRARRLLKRIASRRARVDWKKVDRGVADSDELSRVMYQLSMIRDLPIVINDDNHVTSAMITAEADQLRPDLVIVDNINIMMEPAAYHNENDVKRIGRISRNLKILANDLLIPVICISHMNRQSESRADKRPTLADLRDSGEIEQNADNVIGLYRDVKGEHQQSNILEVWPLKMRDGDTNRPTKFIYDGVYYDFHPAETRDIRI